MLFFDGTGGSGDSIHHYLFAKFAPQHPTLYFDHWAKPIYVLLASPFAQFGFTGVKVFNTITSLITIYLTYRISQKLMLKNEIISALILILSPLCFILTFSGLTEPLFAMFLCFGIYAILSKKLIIATITISFLPFVRSEGLIIIGIFGLYFLLKKEWKLIPLLLFGHLFYSFAGLLVSDDLLWVFNKIPYARLSSTYGNGRLFHFVDQLNYVIGVPIYALFWLGVISIIWKSIKKRISIEIQVLIFISFFAFFIAHTLFWYLGIFSSMGLKRVFIGVAPLISIIALIGFNFITEELFKPKRTVKLISQYLLIASIIIFPFTSNPAAIDWTTDLSLSKDQETAQKVTTLIAPLRQANQCIIYSQPYMSVTLNIDHFDTNQHLDLSKESIKKIKKGDLIIWENWFAVVENGITKKILDDDNTLKKAHEVSVWDDGREIKYAVYIKK